MHSFREIKRCPTCRLIGWSPTETALTASAQPSVTASSSVFAPHHHCNAAPPQDLPPCKQWSMTLSARYECPHRRAILAAVSTGTPLQAAFCSMSLANGKNDKNKMCSVYLSLAKGGKEEKINKNGRELQGCPTRTSAANEQRSL